jgi:hypothetical protein
VSARDAFLVFDRNGNGTIDDGMELFGSAVELRDGSISTQGYAALAELDLFELGGNANRYADLRDSGDWNLRLSTDANQKSACMSITRTAVFSGSSTPLYGHGYAFEAT